MWVDIIMYLIGCNIFVCTFITANKLLIVYSYNLTKHFNKPSNIKQFLFNCSTLQTITQYILFKNDLKMFLFQILGMVKKKDLLVKAFCLCFNSIRMLKSILKRRLANFQTSQKWGWSVSEHQYRKTLFLLENFSVYD